MDIQKTYLGTLQDMPEAYQHALPDDRRVPFEPTDYVSYTEVVHDGETHIDCFVIQAGAFEEDPQAATDAVQEMVREWMDTLQSDF